MSPRNPRQDYRDESEHRNQLRSALNVPYGLTVLLGGLLGRLASEINWSAPLDRWILAVLSATALGLFVKSAYHLVRSSHGQVYKHMPTSREQAEYENELRVWHADYGEGEEGAARQFEAWLEDQYTTAAHTNWYKNAAKSEHLFIAKRWLVFCGVATAFAYMPTLIAQPAPREPLPVAVVSLAVDQLQLGVPDVQGTEQAPTDTTPAEAAPVEGPPRGADPDSPQAAEASASSEEGLTLVVLGGLLGALFALVGQGMWHRFVRAHTGKSLAIALWEELMAVRFYRAEGRPTFAGFSSQTFDSLFPQVASALPMSLGRDVMRYHWRMKYLKAQVDEFGHSTQEPLWEEAQLAWGELRERLDRFGQREAGDIAIRFDEGPP